MEDALREPLEGLRPRRARIASPSTPRSGRPCGAVATSARASATRVSQARVPCVAGCGRGVSNTVETGGMLTASPGRRTAWTVPSGCGNPRLQSRPSSVSHTPTVGDMPARRRTGGVESCCRCRSSRRARSSPLRPSPTASSADLPQRADDDRARRARRRGLREPEGQARGPHHEPDGRGPRGAAQHRPHARGGGGPASRCSRPSTASQASRTARASAMRPTPPPA